MKTERLLIQLKRLVKLNSARNLLLQLTVELQGCDLELEKLVPTAESMADYIPELQRYIESAILTEVEDLF